MKTKASTRAPTIRRMPATRTTTKIAMTPEIPGLVARTLSAQLLSRVFFTLASRT